MHGIVDPPAVDVVREITPAESTQVFDDCQVVPCLQEQGIEVPEAPSLETFLAGRSWTADGDVVRAQLEDLVADGRRPDVEHVFTQVCPVTPPEEVRLGGQG